MIRPLHEMLDLPPETPAAELHCASERHLRAAFERASRGDKDAHSELVSLRFAYLNWAYATNERDPSRASSHKRPAVIDLLPA